MHGRDSFGLRERLHAVLEFFQTARRCEPDDVGTGGQELAQFDVGRTQPRHGARQRAGALVELRARQPAKQIEDRLSRGRHERRIDVEKHAFAPENESGARQTQNVEKS